MREARRPSVDQTSINVANEIAQKSFCKVNIFNYLKKK